MIYNSVVLGLGKIGMLYDINLDKSFVMSHSRALDQNKNFNLIAGIDTNKLNLKKFIKTYKKPGFISIKLLAKNIDIKIKIDLFIISSPTEIHLIHLKEIFLYFKPKIILCEKPISYSLNDANEMLRICKINKTKLFVNYMRRSDSSFHFMNDIIRKDTNVKNKLLGSLFYSKGFLHNASHFFDVFNHILGSFKGFKKLDQNIYLNKYDSIVSVQLNFKYGSVIFLPINNLSANHLSFELITNKYNIKYNNKDNHIFINKIHRDGVFRDSYTYSKNILVPNDFKAFQKNVLNDIEKEFQELKTNLSNGNNAFDILKHMKTIIDNKKYI